MSAFRYILKDTTKVDRTGAAVYVYSNFFLEIGLAMQSAHRNSTTRPLTYKWFVLNDLNGFLVSCLTT